MGFCGFTVCVTRLAITTYIGVQGSGYGYMSDQPMKVTDNCFSYSIQFLRLVYTYLYPYIYTQYVSIYHHWLRAVVRPQAHEFGIHTNALMKTSASNAFCLVCMGG